MNKAAKRIIAIISGIVLIFGSFITAQAGSVLSSAWSYSPVYGYSYQYNAQLWIRSTIPATIEAVTEVYAPSQGIPIGYMGAQARLYTEAGTVLYSTAYTYNYIVTFDLTVATNSTTSTDYYRGRGIVKLYNGSDYEPYYTGYTPYGSTVSAKGITPVSIQPYQYNSRGETYGSALYAEIVGFEPDYISAIGENGESGYVKKTDLNPDLSYEEVLDQINDQKLVDRIPLYDSEGIQIGTFLLSGTVESNVGQRI